MESEIKDKLETIKEEKKGIIALTKQHTDDDYIYTRDVVYQAVEKCMDLLDGASDLAREAEHPRAYEVAAGVSSTLVANVEKLVILQEKMQKLNGVENTGSGTVNNNLNVKMTTKELLELVKGS